MLRKVAPGVKSAQQSQLLDGHRVVQIAAALPAPPNTTNSKREAVGAVISGSSRIVVVTTLLQYDPAVPRAVGEV